MAGQKKKEKKSPATGQWLNFARDSYLERTSRPLYAIVFLLPFVVFYELGTFLVNPDILNKVQGRVVAFSWLQQALQYPGTSDRIAWVAPPLAVIVVLMFQQFASRKPWYFCLGNYTPMVLECTLWATPLIVLGLFLSSPAAGGGKDLAPPDGNTPVVLAGTVIGTGAASVCPLAASPEQTHSLMANIVTGVGAGIYEELIFRLILICVLMMLFQDLIGLNHSNAIVLSVLVSAALFSAHHHIHVVDGQLVLVDQLCWGKFVFRTMAGVYFAILFAIRGFGITAGTHVFYDIIANVINALFFAR